MEVSSHALVHGPGRRRRLRRRGLPQPRPRPPRLPRRRRGLLPAPRRRCSRPSVRGAGWSTSTTSTGGGWLARGRASRSRTFSAAGADADWRAVDVERRRRPGRRSWCSGPTGRASTAAARCPGDFNVANALAARGRVREARASTSPRSPRAMADGGGVPGRLERVDAGQDFAVVVDYAHKPDAVDAALATLRPLTEGAADRRARRRWRPRPRQAADHGRDRGPAGRRARRHRRQPAQRGPGRDPGGRARRRPTPARPRWSRSATGARPSATALAPRPPR